MRLPAEIGALRALAPDGRWLLATRAVRMFAFGAVAVILALYLAEIGLVEEQIGLLLTATLVGDALISLLIAGVADRFGRRAMLRLGAGLVILAGLVFALTPNVLPLLIAAALLGTLSPTGHEVGPFLSVEQAALAQTTDGKSRTAVFAWYNLSGYLATAGGALASGAATSFAQSAGVPALASYRGVMAAYALLGLLLLVMFAGISPAVEVTTATTRNTGGLFGLGRSRRRVLGLSALFMVDAFGGGLIVQSLIAYWFHVRWEIAPGALGGIFFAANLLAGFSALAAARIAARFGLINTMVWTHMPSNVLLILVPLMPSAWLAVGVLLVRFCISQMDVPTRQSYVMSVVSPEERSAAAGVTSIVRTVAAAIGPSLTGLMFGASLLSLPFFLAGGLKLAYDLALYRSFIGLRPAEE